MIESWMIDIGVGAITFISLIAVVKHRQNELEKKIIIIENDERQYQLSITKKLDNIREDSVLHNEKIQTLYTKLEALDEKFMTDKEVEQKYLQKLIFEQEIKHINEKFDRIEKKLDDNFTNTNILLQEILTNLT